MKIAIVGTGYVGLVTGTCFAEIGVNVVCVDTNSEKIEALKKGVIPIYENGLEEMVIRNAKAGRLQFTTSLEECLNEVEAVFSAVGTPPDEDGSADLSYVLAVARTIGQYMNKYLLVVTKSTVPVGTAQKVRNVIQEELDKRGVKLEFDVLYDDLGPDMKSQVSYDYETNSVLKVLVSVQHKSDKDHDYVYEVVKRVVGEVLGEYKVNYDSIDSILLVNPTGRFVIGGPEGDCGVTGRKIVVDSYGAKARVGGGAYSGKDPTKVDRSAAYMCRYIAKNIVMSGICNECEVYLSYAIGVSQPFSLEVVTDNKLGSSFDRILSNFVSSYFGLSPREIISYLNLKDLDYISIDMGNIYGDNVLGIVQPWEEEEPVFGARLKKLFLKELNK